MMGVVRGRGDLAASGRLADRRRAGRLPGVSVFSEVVVGIGGGGDRPAGRHGLAALLILAGLVLVGRRLLAARRP
jgi:hypothetical protein